MELTIITQSLLPPKPGEPDPWPLVVQRIRDSKLIADYVLFNECKGWAADDSALLRRAQKDLGMSAMPLAASESGLGTLILYRPETVGEPLRVRPATADDPGTLNEDRTGRTYHGWSIGFWQLDLPQPLAVCSYKLTPYSVDAARIEAAYVGSHVFRQGAYCLGGGDLNFAPADPDNPAPNWQSQYPYNIGSRAISGTPATGEPLADRSVAQQFEDKGLRDVAWELAKATGDRSLLVSTSEFDRIDIGFVTPILWGNSLVWRAYFCFLAAQVASLLILMVATVVVQVAVELTDCGGCQACGQGGAFTVPPTFRCGHL
jgi:hypothetical protein